MEARLDMTITVDWDVKLNSKSVDPGGRGPTCPRSNIELDRGCGRHGHHVTSYSSSSSSSSVPPLTYRRTSFSPRVRVLPSPDPNDRTTMPATNRHLNIFTVFLSLRVSYFTSVLEKRSQCLPYNAERQAR